MKRQNNFTDVEQSKRLLEIGVPADSADCYLTRFGIDEDWEVKVLNYVKYSELAISNQKYCLPCLSVGRLMEIFEICSGQVWQNEIIENYSKVDMLLEDFEDVEKKYTFDFSKLED